MGYRLGVDIGTTFTAAAVCRDGRAEMLGLGNRAMQVPSVLFLKDDGEFLVGEAAETRAAAEPERVAREFKRRLGDPVPVLVAGRPFSAEALTARLLSWVVGMAAERQGEPPETVAVAHPANWGRFKTDLLRQAFQLADMPGVVTCTEPVAAAVSYASRQPVAEGRVLAVYDLGGGTFDAAVLRLEPDGFAILGVPEGIEHLGGVDFDEAVFRHVLAAANTGPVDPDDPQVMWGLQRLRRDCVAAKEALSVDTDTVVPVSLAGRHETVRLTRGELEELLRPAVEDTIGTMRRVLRSAEVDREDVSAFVLVGGSSRIPLVSEVLTGAFGRPLALDTHPKHDIARGAALYADPAAVPAAGPAPSDATDTRPLRTEPTPPATDRDTAVLTPATRWRLPNRRPVALAAGGLVLAVLVALGVLVWPGTNNRPGSAHQSSTQHPRPPIDRPVGPPLPTNVVLWEQKINDGTDEIYAGQVGSTHEHVFLPGVQVSGFSLSKDRRTIAYVDANDQLQLVGTGGGRPRPLFKTRPAQCPYQKRPSFAYRDTELVIPCYSAPPSNNGRTSLRLVRLDGTFVGKSLVTGYLGEATVNSNSTLVGYWRGKNQKSTQIWTVSLSDGRTERVTHDHAADNDPTFSPTDPNIIAYRHGYGPDADIYTISVASGNVHPYPQPDQQQDPSWSPDGKQIACQTGPSDKGTIAIITRVHDRFNLLTHNHVANRLPGWSAK